MNKHALTAPEVAEILKIAPNTVYALVKRGELNCYKVGRKMRFTYEDVERYINQSRGIRVESEYTNLNKKEQENDAQESGKHATIQSAAGSPVGDIGVSGSAFCICGQDEILDVLAKYMNVQMPGLHTDRINRGSYDSLVALYKDQVSVSASHMWDSETDTYNETYLSKLLPGCKLVLVHVAKRSQGFYVQEGNPKQIRGWEDLNRSDLVIANREPGAGTRVLLDEHLKNLGINGRDIAGYDRIFLTHMAVAGCISKGDADLGIGTEKTAGNMRGVEFIPLQMEQYDLIFKAENIQNPNIQLMIKILQSEEFKEQFAFLNGYDVSNMGEVVFL